MLLPEDVRAVPYWIDDVTLRSSIIASGAEDLLKTSEGANQVALVIFYLTINSFDNNR